MKALDEDLQRILNVGAKVYDVSTKRQGKVVSVSNESVQVDYGNNAHSEVVSFEIEEFKQKLVEDKIVANHRLTMGSGNNFKVRPRSGQPVNNNTVHKPQSKPSTPPVQTNQPKLKVGYINFKTGKFSDEQKKGYTKVEYKKSTQQVTLELDDDALRKLKEMGLV